MQMQLTDQVFARSCQSGIPVVKEGFAASDIRNALQPRPVGFPAHPPQSGSMSPPRSVVVPRCGL